MDLKEKQNPDEKISGTLAKRYRQESRRSFISKLTRFTFAVAGVKLANTLKVFAGPPLMMYQSSNWQYCGLSGYLCGTGNCSGGTVGSGPGRKWNACCDADPTCGDWRCCTYTDRCKSTVHTPSGCSAPNGVSGLVWCGNQSNQNYVCTDVSCGATQGATTQGACSCTGTQCN